MKWLSKKPIIRMRALGEKLSTCEYDIICLQELWVYEVYLYLQNKVRHYASHAHFFHGGFLGSGLAIFSRWPIVSTSMYPFRLNGRPSAIWRGDWYAGKGVATAVVSHPSGQLIEVFTTHVKPPHALGLHIVSRSIREGNRYLYVSSHCAGLGYGKASTRCR